MTVDGAIVSRLRADAALLAAAPGDVWLDYAPAGTAEPYVIVRLLVSSDVPMCEGRAFHEATYRVEAIAAAGAGASVEAVEARILALLDGAAGEGVTFTAGAWTIWSERAARVRAVEVDEETGLRVQHCGGDFVVTVNG